MPAAAWSGIAELEAGGAFGDDRLNHEAIEIGAERGAAVAGQDGADPGAGGGMPGALDVAESSRARGQPIGGGGETGIERQLLLHPPHAFARTSPLAPLRVGLAPADPSTSPTSRAAARARRGRARPNDPAPTGTAPPRAQSDRPGRALHRDRWSARVDRAARDRARPRRAATSRAAASSAGSAFRRNRSRWTRPSTNRAPSAIVGCFSASSAACSAWLVLSGVVEATGLGEGVGGGDRLPRQHQDGQAEQQEPHPGMVAQPRA